MKRILSTILIISLLLSSIPMTSFATTATQIPDDAVNYNGHAYKVYKEALEWEAAKTRCESLGGHLVTITSKEENEFVVSMISGGKYHIGGSDVLTEGTWQWVTGETWEWTNWDSRGDQEPNNLREQDYLMIHADDSDDNALGSWDDGYSIDSYVAGFVCEWDYELESNTSIKVGDTIILGTYYNEPILWRCVDIDDNGPLMLSEKILCLKAFDANGENSFYHSDGWGYVRKQWGSNCWSDSNLRQWLNSDETEVAWTHCPPKSSAVTNNSYDNEAGFLTNFTDVEKSLIKTVTQKVGVNIWETKRNGYCDGGSSDRGYKYVFNTSFNISAYYYQNVTDDIFLLNASQINRIYNANKNYLYATPTEQAISNSNYTSSGLTTDKNWDYWVCVPWGMIMHVMSIQCVLQVRGQ